MKVIDFRQVPPKEEVEGVNLRLVISSEDGASTFVMRVLEVESGHSTPSHDHDWDHEVFVLAGEGAVMSGGGMTPLAPGSVVFADAPLEYDLNLLPRWNLRCDLRRNGDLAVRREFAPEVSGLHIRSLVPYIISRVRKQGGVCSSALAVL